MYETTVIKDGILMVGKAEIIVPALALVGAAAIIGGTTYIVKTKVIDKVINKKTPKEEFKEFIKKNSIKERLKRVKDGE